MTSFRAVFAAGLTAAIFVLVTAMQAPAAGCGDPAPPPDGDGNVTAADALYCLQMAVGSQPVNLTTCDADDGGTAAASDALRILQSAVGQIVTLVCPIGSTTTTTLQGCEGSTGPACGGDCPAGEFCTDDGFGCDCIPGCEGEEAPFCGAGDCTTRPGWDCQHIQIALPDLGESEEFCECLPPDIQLCEDTLASGCDGVCGDGQLCENGSGGCTCSAQPLQGSCAGASQPACGGTCGPGEICTTSGPSGCACAPSGFETCLDQSGPSCGGSCFGGALCAVDIFGDCDCFSPCELDGDEPTCGGSCVEPGDQCVHIQATVNGGTLDLCSCEPPPPPPSCFSSPTPTCGGDCPAGEFCTDDGFGCDCIPGCEGEEAPFCGAGDCTTRPGWVCQNVQIALPALGESDQFCECLPPDIQLCEDTAASGCDGVCSPGQVCEDNGGCTCSAQPAQGSCAEADQPACGGTCGTGQICAPSGQSGCACVSSGFETCFDQSGPSCGGSCFGGALCAADIFGGCECFSPCELGDPQTCGGGSCVESGDPCVHIQATVGGETLDLCSCE